MNKISLKLKQIFNKDKMPKLETILTVMMMSFMLVTTFFVPASYAAGDYGQNTYEWAKTQIFYLALVVIAFFCVKYAAKKAWAAFGGFAVLGALVLVIVDDPQKLKAVGTTIWQIVFK